MLSFRTKALIIYFSIEIVEIQVKLGRIRLYFFEFYVKISIKLIVVSFFIGGRSMAKMGREELIAMYRPDVERLAAFLPWLTGKTAGDVVQNYTGENGEVTLPFPVYDDILLAFLDTLGTTVFMNTNYRYIYSQYRIQDWHDELTMIQKADIMSMEILGGIFSKYTLGGMTRAYLWSEGMDFQIFYHGVKRAKEIIEYWDVPIVVEAVGVEPVEE